MKSQSFISLICVLNRDNLHSLERVARVQKTLELHYADYEILLITQKSVAHQIQKTIGHLLGTVPSLRYLQLASDVSNDVAWSAGLENAIGDFIVLYDLVADPIDIIDQSISKCKSGTDVIVGTCNYKNSFFYNLLRPFAQFLLKLADYDLPRNASTFRCLSRRAANAVMETGNFHHQFFMRIQKSGYPMLALNYVSAKPVKRSFLTGFRELIRLMVFNSSSPLRLMSVLGFSGSVVGMVFALYSLVIQLLRNDVVEGWTSTFFLISFFSMLQFIILAFISEYIARILEEHGQKSPYSIVYEKLSFVMINADRVNVLKESTSQDLNLVSTARNN